MGTQMVYMALVPFVTIFAIMVSIFHRFFNYIQSLSATRRNISGQVFLVTGGGSGIGRGVALRMSRLGCIVVTWDVNAAGNEETKKMIEEAGGKCYAYTVDLCDRQQIYSTAEKVKKDVGKVEILMNNAGVVTGKELIDSSDDWIQRTFDVNVLSYIYAIKAFLPEMMRDNRGQIVTMGSISSFYGNRMMADYSASKFAVLGLVESLNEEFNYNGYDGIAQTFVAPFYINTGMFAGVESKAIEILDPDVVCDKIAEAIVLKTPELMIPPTLEALIFLKRWMSPLGVRILAKFLETDKMMKNFVGRKKVH